MGIGHAGLECTEASPQLLGRGGPPFEEFEVQAPSRLPLDLQIPERDRIGRVVERHDTADAWNQILQQLDSLRTEVRDLAVHSRESPAGLADALNQAGRDRIAPGVEHN